MEGSEAVSRPYHYPKRIYIGRIIGQAIWDALGHGSSRGETTRLLTDFIVKKIQNNYRRRDRRP